MPAMKNPLLAATLAALLLPALAVAQQRDCGPLPSRYDGLLFASDGDTLYAPPPYPPIRVWGVQAPELRDANKQETATGMRARGLVEDLLVSASHKGQVEPAKWDRFCRVVALVTVGGRELGLELIKAGLGYGFYLSETTPFGPDKSASYAAAEAEARAAKRGLWPDWLGTKSPPSTVERPGRRN